MCGLRDRTVQLTQDGCAGFLYQSNKRLTFTSFTCNQLKEEVTVEEDGGWWVKDCNRKWYQPHPAESAALITNGEIKKSRENCGTVSVHQEEFKEPKRGTGELTHYKQTVIWEAIVCAGVLIQDNLHQQKILISFKFTNRMHGRSLWMAILYCWGCFAPTEKCIQRAAEVIRKGMKTSRWALLMFQTAQTWMCLQRTLLKRKW